LQTPQFGEEGHGSLWLAPQRKNEFWDARNGPYSPHGFYHFNERDLILPRIFGIGNAPHHAQHNDNGRMDHWRKHS